MYQKTVDDPDEWANGYHVSLDAEEVVTVRREQVELARFRRPVGVRLPPGGVGWSRTRDLSADARRSIYSSSAGRGIASNASATSWQKSQNVSVMGSSRISVMGTRIKIQHPRSGLLLMIKRFVFSLKVL